MEIEKAKQVKARHEQAWLAHPQVVSIGVGLISENEAGIIIGVTDEVEQIRKSIPQQIDGIPIVIEKTDPPHAF